MRYVRKERRFYPSLFEQVPVYFGKEWMVFHFLYPIGAQPILWFSLDESIDEIYTFLGPSIGRYLIELYLFG